ncbi:sugar phosphate isomerase/epimerase family protein [Falsibacillus pallidus]|uniref:Sugar phosphate isomerase/epimerase n=1 Tax=Falsibacillus pallidus TaxID=493781 RepID=A0A370GB22_9BACI|nr:TIM barrel protein [Falsibacillus pallidus]RDI40931.1 sugar phosphate isomerase/epimerase [Falsibacillus pallidus]
MQNVIVPLNSFDSFEVLENGQASFIELIAKSGAFGVEIRRELLSSYEQELEKIKQEIDRFGLFTVYSAPVELWREDHQFNEAAIRQVYQEGEILGAKWLKVSLGHYKKAESNLGELIPFLNKQKDIQLLVENDQTLHSGNIKSLKTFFESANEEGVPVKMTFDAGNWFYSKEDPNAALEELSPYVIYLHLKQVEKGPITVPLQKNGDHSWKTIMRQLSPEMIKALEFPIEPKEKVTEYIRLLTDVLLESEAKS